MSNIDKLLSGIPNSPGSNQGSNLDQLLQGTFSYKPEKTPQVVKPTVKPQRVPYSVEAVKGPKDVLYTPQLVETPGTSMLEKVLTFPMRMGAKAFNVAAGNITNVANRLVENFDIRDKSIPEQVVGLGKTAISTLGVVPSIMGTMIAFDAAEEIPLVGPIVAKPFNWAVSKIFEAGSWAFGTGIDKTPTSIIPDEAKKYIKPLAQEIGGVVALGLAFKGAEAAYNKFIVKPQIALKQDQIDISLDNLKKGAQGLERPDIVQQLESIKIPDKVQNVQQFYDLIAKSLTAEQNQLMSGKIDNVMNTLISGGIPTFDTPLNEKGINYIIEDTVNAKGLSSNLVNKIKSIVFPENITPNQVVKLFQEKLTSTEWNQISEHLTNSESSTLTTLNTGMIISPKTAGTFFQKQPGIYNIPPEKVILPETLTETEKAVFYKAKVEPNSLTDFDKAIFTKAMDKLKETGWFDNQAKTVNDKIQKAVDERVKKQIVIDQAEAKRIMNEVVKDIPIKGDTGEMVIPAKSATTEMPATEEIVIDTAQKTVLQNLIRDQENLNYVKVGSLGTDAVTGDQIKAKFEWDYKTQQGTIYTTKDTTSENIAQELGHYFDKTLSTRVDQTISDFLGGYSTDKTAQRSLVAYVVKEAGGNIKGDALTKGVSKLVKQLQSDIGTLAEKETRLAPNEKFASAVREVLLRPTESSVKAPTFTKFIQDQLAKDTAISKRLKQLQQAIAPKAPKEVAKGAPKEGVKVPTKGTTPERAQVSKGITAEKPVKGEITKVLQEKGIAQATVKQPTKRVTALSYNKEKINAPADVERLFKEVAKQEGEFKEQRVSKSNEDLKKLAAQVGVTPDELIATKPGSIANAETVLRARQVTMDLSKDVVDTLKSLDRDTATKPQLEDLRKKVLRLTGTMKAVAGLRTEASHLFRQFQIEAGPGEYDVMKELVSRLKQIDKESAGDVEKFGSLVKKELEPTIGDKIWHLWYMNILSGASTQIKNAGGNIGSMLVEIGRVATTNPGELPLAISGLYDGLLKGRSAALDILKTGESAKLEERNAKVIVFTGKTPLGKALASIGNSFDYVGRFMSATDALFREGFKGMEKYGNAREVARKEGLTGKALDQRIQDLIEQPTAEMEMEINQFGRKGVYMQKPEGVIGWLSNAFSNMMQVRKGEKLGIKVAKTVGRTIIPFTRVVSNVINNGLDWTPIGFIREGIPERFVDIVKGEQKSFTRVQKQELGRAILGTVGMTYLASVAEQGKLSGAGPSSKKERDVLYASGWRPNSVKIGDIWYPYQNWGPASIPMTLVGNFHDSLEYGNLDQKNLFERTTYAVEGSVNSILNMSFLSGLSDLMSSLQYQDPSYVKRYIAGQLTIPVPALYKQINKIFDPTNYEANTIKEQIMLQLGITSGLKPKLNVFGDKITRDPISGLTPIKESDDPLYKFLAKESLWVSVPGKATLIRDQKTGEKRQMTPDEYYNYVKLSGPAIKNELNIRLPMLQSMKDHDQQQKLIDDLVTKQRELIKVQIQSGTISFVGKTKIALEDLIVNLLKKETV